MFKSNFFRGCSAHLLIRSYIYANEQMSSSTLPRTVVVAQFSHCRGTVLSLPWHSIAAVVGELSHRNERTVPPQ
ncbi:MAG: hypothetical protein IJT97_03550 [Bacteroidaceae bacterium]|nr:hypothetical protein [Bacteroidaceae bacterium]